MIKTKREIVVDIWKTNPFAIAWKKKLNRSIKQKCDYICTSNFRKVGYSRIISIKSFRIYIVYGNIK